MTSTLLQGLVRQALLPCNWQHQHSVRPVMPCFLWLTQHWDSPHLLLNAVSENQTCAATCFQVS